VFTFLARSAGLPAFDSISFLLLSRLFRAAYTKRVGLQVMLVSACAARLLRPFVNKSIVSTRHLVAQRSSATLFRISANRLLSVATRLQSSASRFVYVGLTMATTAATAVVLSDEERKLIERADQLFDANNWIELEQLLDKPELQQQSSNRAEFEWRLARCWYQQIKEKQRDDKQIEKAKDLVMLALQHNPECGPAHKVRLPDRLSIPVLPKTNDHFDLSPNQSTS
jgi:hypothetical protein